MVNDSRSPISSGKLIIILVIAIILVMLGTVALNGGVSSPPEEVETTVNESNTTKNIADEYVLLGNNSYGTVSKSSGYGNPSSDIHIAFILGVDAKSKSPNAIVPTIQDENNLNYCYDVYIIDAVSSSNNDDTNSDSNLTVNDKSESLASEFVVPDIIKNNYNFTMDIHSTNDSNSYVFVPSDDTYTSKEVVASISNNTNVGRYTPDSHSYTKDISESIIDYEIPSVVYVTRDYYSDGVSSEISSIIECIDNFDFNGLFTSDVESNTDYLNSTPSNNTDVQVINVSNTSGNKEV